MAFIFAVGNREFEKKGFTSKVLWNLGFWSTIIYVVLFIVYRQFYYKSLLIMGFLGFVLLVVSFVTSVTSIIYNLFLLIKYKKKNILPFVLFGIQVILVIAAYKYPVPDYYAIHHKELGLLISVADKQLIHKEETEVQVPKSLKSIKGRYIDASKKNGVLKIRVELTGSLFSGHSFLLYKSNGKVPSQDELNNSSEHKSTYKRKSRHWFLIDWND